MRKLPNLWRTSLVVSILLAALFTAHSLRPVQSQNQGGLPFTTLNAATTGTGTALATNNAVQVGWAVIWSADVTAGEVVIEAAMTKDYAGTWAELDRQAFGDAPSDNAVMMGTYPGPLPFVRARVTTTVTDGTVTVQLMRLTN
jgi:hypothetical protein